MKITNKLFRRQYVQNRNNWCWAVCCKIVGERYRSRHKTFLLDLKDFIPPEELGHGVYTYDLSGIRQEFMEPQKNMALVDAWQRAVVMNANTEKYFGFEGDVAGDDRAKELGLRYIVTGDILSKRVYVETWGNAQDETLLYGYKDQVMKLLCNNEAILGNVVIRETGIYHSIVLLDCIQEGILLYDPYDGTFHYSSVEQLLITGYTCALGTARVRWVQVIV